MRLLLENIRRQRLPAGWRAWHESACDNRL